jgi:ketosteroid isomerase-like protein
MKKVIFSIAAVFLLAISLEADAFGTGPSSAQATPSLSSAPLEDSATISAAITAMDRQFAESFVKGDSSLFLNCYTDDACLLLSNAPALCGKKAALAFYKLAYRRMGIRNAIITSRTIYGDSENYVTEQGAYEMVDANNKTLDKGKFLVLWKKTGNGWKMFRDMFSSDAPPPAMPASK